MGRRKQAPKKLKLGSVYQVDRRRDGLVMFRRLLSRQFSKMNTNDNLIRVSINRAPCVTTMMVLENITCWGKDYTKLLVVNTDGITSMGYVETWIMGAYVSRGELQWEPA